MAHGTERTMRQVTVQVEAEAARALQQGETSGTSERLQEVARELGVTLTPMHPDIDDPELAAYYTVETPDAETAELVAIRLQSLEAIAFAYVKPADALP